MAPDREVMRRMRLLPAAAALLTAAALPLALAACTTGSPPVPGQAAGPPSVAPSVAPSPANPDAGLLTGTQLRGLLEPRAYFPRGYVRDPAGTRDTGPGYQQPGSTAVAKPDCRLLGATSWTSITGISGVSFAEDAYLDKASSSEIAQEIDVYRGTISRAVMRQPPVRGGRVCRHGDRPRLARRHHAGGRAGRHGRGDGAVHRRRRQRPRQRDEAGLTAGGGAPGHDLTTAAGSR
jgi:hypothetical protein